MIAALRACLALSAAPMRHSRWLLEGFMLVSDHIAPPAARLSDYVAIARPDHWIKHVLIIPGVAFAMIMSAAGPFDATMLAQRLIACLLVAMALSSANYTINEWLDAPFDAMHPTKRVRPAVQTAMSPKIVFAQYIALTSLGVLVAHALGGAFSLAATVFAIFGVIYNVRPIRAKDRAFLDVIVESLNNPLRFLFGWFAVTPDVAPPAAYMRLALTPDSPAARPEELVRQTAMLIAAAVTLALFAALTFVDLPWLNGLTSSDLIHLWPGR